MALLNARSADTAHAMQEHNSKNQIIQNSSRSKLKNRPGRETEKELKKHMRGAIPSSETDSEFLTRSKQRMEISSSLAVDMPLLLTRETEKLNEEKKKGIKTAVSRWK